MTPQIEEITDNGTESFTPQNRGRHLIEIGGNSDVAFDSASIDIQQNGISLVDVDGNTLDTETAPGRHVVDGIIDGVDIDFVVTSVAGAAANIDIAIYKLAPGDLIA